MATIPKSSGQSQEAMFLRENWVPEVLGMYEGEWIAVIGHEIAFHDKDLTALLSATGLSDPLYAYVTFEDLQ